MITGAILGALTFGGLALVITAVFVEDITTRDMAIITVGAAITGAGFIGGLSAISAHNNEPCPEDTVKAGPGNDKYIGCVPVELAEKDANNA